jgi:hypothetical protein
LGILLLGSPQAFFGNPNAGISAINTGGGIVCSRTSGTTPCFVQVSASGTAATGTSAPYEDLEYRWNFGDPSGTEIFVRPTDGVTVNANDSQIAPEAAYVYRTAGTKTITLTVRGGNGAVVAVVTQNITVAAYATTYPAATTWYYDQNASGTNNGTSPTNAFTDFTTHPNTKLSAGQATQIFFAQKSTFTTSAGISIPNAASVADVLGIRLTSYVGVTGAGARPTIDVSSGSSIPCEIGNGSNSFSKGDIVVQGIRFTNSGTTAAAIIGGNLAGSSSKTYSNIYTDDCVFECLASNPVDKMKVGDLEEIFGASNHITSNFGFWKTSFLSPIVVSPATTGPKHGFYGGPRDWMFFTGCTFSGSGIEGFLDHHIYPDTQTHSLYSWNTFGATGATGTQYQRFFCVNLNWNSLSGGLEYVQYVCVSQNQCGTSSGTSPSLLHDAAQSSPGQVGVFAGGGSANITYTTTGTITAPVVGGFLYFQTNGTLPSGWAPMVPYYIRSVSGTGPYSITLSDDGGATAKTAATTGSGSHNIYNVGYKDFVTQGNALIGLDGDGVVPIPQAFTHTMRDNRVWGNASGRFYSPDPRTSNTLGPKFYRNRGVTPSTADNNPAHSAAAIELTYSASPSQWTSPVQVTDNTWVDLRTNPQCAATDFSTQPAVGTIWDRNAYYGSADCLFNVTTIRTFAQWQAQLLDLNGSKSTGTPAGWTVPPTRWSDLGS